MAPQVTESRFAWIRVCTFAVLLGASVVSPAADWPAFGNDPGGSQHSSLTQIDKQNVKQLKRVWTHRSGDVIDAPAPNGTILQTTPLHVNDTLYFCTPLNRVFALDPRTGRERWIFDPHREGISAAPDRPMRCRGVAYWAEANTTQATACARRTGPDSGRQRPPRPTPNGFARGRRSWSRGTARVMILGNICTRSCNFCAIQTGRPTEYDIAEPARVAEAVARMGLRHAVITMVARDDLADGGASAVAATRSRYWACPKRRCVACAAGASA